LASEEVLVLEELYFINLFTFLPYYHITIFPYKQVFGRLPPWFVFT